MKDALTLIRELAAIVLYGILCVCVGVTLVVAWMYVVTSGPLK